jgi:2-polyprenyl-6-methoxyphenol hydroxylase-like FAD-dependent oxidoreductase
MEPLNILVVGCGIAGSTLASFLLLSNDVPTADKPRITVLERSPAQRTQGQNVDVRGAGVTIIQKLGLEGVIRESTTGEVGVQWVDERNQVWASLGADKSGNQSTPTADIEIMRGRLAELCWLRAETISQEVKAQGGAGIEFVFGDHLQSIDQDGRHVHVVFAKSQQKRTYDLIVGADGLQSEVRRLVWGADGEEGRLNRLNSYGAYFSIPKGPTDTDWRRWYHATKCRNIMVRPDKQRGRTSVHMFVINDSDQRLQNVIAKGRENVTAQRDLLDEYFHDAGWESQRLLSEMRNTSDFYCDMAAQVRMDSYSTGRVVLVGDAG